MISSTFSRNFAFGGSPATGPAVPAPIMNWRLNETSGTVITDYSGNGYNGRVDGSPTLASDMGNGNTGIQLTAGGQGVSIAPADMTPVINAIRTGSYSQSIVLRNMGSNGAHTPCAFVIWNNPGNGYAVTNFIDYVPTWSHRAGWSSDTSINIGNLGASYAPSAYNSQTFVLTYVYDKPNNTIKLFRNGVIVASSVIPNLNTYVPSPPSGDRVQLGGHLNFPGSYQYIGKASDLIIWDKALSDVEALALYNQKGRV